MEAALNSPFGRTLLGPTGLTIGCVADNQLVISDPQSSGHHAEIRAEGQGYSITDLGSTNGTFVNEQRLTANVPRSLNAGDVIRIGDTKFTYEVSGVSAFDPTVYANPSQGSTPGYQPTVAAPPPYTDYGAGGQQGYQPPPPPQAPASAYPQQGYQQPPPPAYPVYPPPPSQQAYAPPAGQPGYPGYAAPVVPQRRSRRGLWIALSIIGGVVLLGCIGCGVLVFAVGLAASTPTKTLDTFCTALKNGDYQTAYNQLSNRLQSGGSESEFAQAFSTDKVSSCTYDSLNTSGSSATANLRIGYNSGRSENDTATLIQDSNSVWKIDNVQTR